LAAIISTSFKLLDCNEEDENVDRERIFMGLVVGAMVDMIEVGDIDDIQGGGSVFKAETVKDAKDRTVVSVLLWLTLFMELCNEETRRRDAMMMMDSGKQDTVDS
jgi:hypothetical protein